MQVKYVYLQIHYGYNAGTIQIQKNYKQVQYRYITGTIQVPYRFNGGIILVPNMYLIHGYNASMFQI